ncbi:MAG: PD-(D/E)XK nuclease family protein [Gammaproteobacteria bacterium]|nr:PD-(D/E)XK nuclease family protein [Gammaproteobacteria bacterium]
MRNTIELSEKKTLVPNVVCKREFHKLVNQQSMWARNIFLTYSDLIPSYARNIHSTWYFYQKINDIVFDGQASLNKVLNYWQQTQFKLLNNHYDKNEHDLVAILFKHLSYHPSLYPLWFFNNPVDQQLSILPYQWQPIENTVFEKNNWHISFLNIHKFKHCDQKLKYINNFDDVSQYITESKNTLIIVSELNAYWMHKRHSLDAGVIDTKPLTNHPLLNYISGLLNNKWQKQNLTDTYLTTKLFTNECLEYLYDFLENQSFSDIELIIIKRIIKLIEEMSDDRTHSLQIHLENLLLWLESHQVSIYISHDNTMITTPKHAFPYMYDECIIINLDNTDIEKLYFSNNQDIINLNFMHNNNIYRAKSNYQNISGFKLNQDKFNVTDFIKFQRCPIIYACQNKLKIENEQASVLKMHIGIITHAVLADFWLTIKDQATLKKHTSNELKTMLNDLIEKHIETIDKNKKIDLAYWTFQKSHLTQTIFQWLSNELDRTPFKVVAVEKQIHLNFNGKLIKGRVDRVDYIEGLGYFIIDYKTGYAQSIQSTLEGFPDPQMLVYTKALEYDIVGIGYALITTGQLKSIQFLDQTHETIPYYEMPDIEDIIQKHINLFNDILKPLPYEPRQCIKCDFQSICHHASSSK